jgi:hypothetical protein
MSRRHSSIEETFQAVQPRGYAGVPEAPTISVGANSAGGDLGTALSQAGQQIAQLQSAYQQQATLISANTSAIQGNTSAQSAHSSGSTAANVASSVFGGALGFLSPLVSGIASLFGGGGSQPTVLPVYAPPPPVAISSTIQNATPTAGSAQSAQAPAASAAQQITVQVNAMDSQSIMDRSNDIANAVRAAMLNLHPINDVVASL